MVFMYNTGTGTGSTVEQADLTSQINGSRDVFTIPEADTSSVRVYFNGLRQVQGENFTVTNSTSITLDFIPQIGDFLTIDYTPA
tara:strand:+ start:25 stop:276 length:252 start_codon:yes stop_codon:yes gene_type:complete